MQLAAPFSGHGHGPFPLPSGIQLQLQCCFHAVKLLCGENRPWDERGRRLQDPRPRRPIRAPLGGSRSGHPTFSVRHGRQGARVLLKRAHWVHLRRSLRVAVSRENARGMFKCTCVYVLCWLFCFVFGCFCVYCKYGCWLCDYKVWVGCGREKRRKGGGAVRCDDFVCAYSCLWPGLQAL